MKLTLRAYAKVNLSLEVLGKRPDGYHEIVTILQTVSLCDTLTVEPARRLEVSAPGLDCAESENLVVRAAQLLQEATGCTRGAHIHLEKRIPAAAGLGGGSSNAAAALAVLNRLWGLELVREALVPLAAKLGSDVPFFLHGGTALAQGRGELLTPLPPLAGYWVVLAVPPLAIPHKTRTLYASLTPGDFSDGSATLQVVEDLRAGRGLAGALAETVRPAAKGAETTAGPGGKAASSVPSAMKPTRPRLVNAFDRPCLGDYPLIATYRQALLAAGAPFARISGSGPALFTVVDDETAAQAICQRLADQGLAGQPARFQAAARDK